MKTEMFMKTESIFNEPQPPSSVYAPTGNWIQTFLGGKFHPTDPVPEEVNLIDIAHALANQCRFTGHVREFYSIAQHCVLVSLVCNPEDALWGLLHDAAEAYISDLSRPVKYDPRLAAYKEVEKDIEKVIADHFGLSMPEPPSVKAADRRLLFTERRDLLPFVEWEGWGMGLNAEPLPEAIIPWSPKEAEQKFLDRYEELTCQKKTRTV